ncbi:glycosyltransferase family 2 protein [Patescibacteria group bacterium]|nr:glycosyltransferase family 2 protein [Patescibacteria group bacterium]MBU0777367.1 glycosyltransferase family 2 protein [Patescibacteria group bacterium]MBU0845995.1 glycosyltransferase family 2 protein [Patescibacteria group bacterium]MBU0922544.1 glycosyltransferase family 2 protein [Patescibacteria group bacterium]MBU1066523.1 glycosyltransferase family 2 protein [Patescibacteria group bacterium]
MKLSVILPAKDEEGLLSTVLKDITSYLDVARLTYEVVVVENGSSDNTLEIAKACARKNFRIKVECLLEPAYGKALIRGIKKARGRYIVIFNVDFWDKKFIDLINADLLGYDLVTGSKLLSSSKDNRSLNRKLITFFFNLFLKIFFGFKGTDTHGIKAFRRNILLPIINRCRTETGIFDSELVIRSQRAGLDILELPVEIIERRSPRFSNRIFQTPADLIKLYAALKR